MTERPSQLFSLDSDPNKTGFLLSEEQVREALTINEGALLSPARERFLVGLLCTWLSGDRKPTKQERARAEGAARAALEAIAE